MFRYFPNFKKQFARLRGELDLDKTFGIQNYFVATRQVVVLLRILLTRVEFL